MDPLAQSMQLLQEAMSTIQLLAEEVQVLREHGRDNKKDEKKEISKTASEVELSSIFGVDANQLPEFVKHASQEEAQSFLTLVENNVRFSTLGKVAEYSDGVSFSDPNEALESRLSSIIAK